MVKIIYPKDFDNKNKDYYIEVISTKKESLPSDDDKLSFEEHKLIGSGLKLIDKKLDLTKYSFKTKAIWRKSPLSKGDNLSSSLRFLLESVLYEDYPSLAKPDIYYDIKMSDEENRRVKEK